MIDIPLQIMLLSGVVGAAVITDIRSHRIPNALCLFGIGAGLALHLTTSGFVAALLHGVGGMTSAALLLLPLYILGGMAAGDVKLMAAVGCIVGIPASFMAVAYSLVSGLFLGLAYLILRGGFPEIRDRYWPALATFTRTRQFLLAPPQPGAVSQSRFPYAVAIATGSLLSVT